MNPRRNILHFIRLQMPDKVPMNRLAGKFPLFLPELLNIIFSEIENACLQRLCHIAAAEGLRIGNEGYFLRFPPRTRGCRCDSPANDFDVFSDHERSKSINILDFLTKINDLYSFLLQHHLTSDFFFMYISHRGTRVLQ